jgi:Tfp pilus assembly protein PilX
MKQLDRWEDEIERAHPALYVVLVVGLLLALIAIGVAWSAVAPMG